MKFEEPKWLMELGIYCDSWIEDNRPEDASRREAYYAGAKQAVWLYDKYWHEYVPIGMKEQLDSYIDEIKTLNKEIKSLHLKLEASNNFIKEVLNKELP